MARKDPSRTPTRLRIRHSAQRSAGGGKGANEAANLDDVSPADDLRPEVERALARLASTLKRGRMRVRDLFVQFDTDGDGELSVQEFSDGLSAM